MEPRHRIAVAHRVVAAALGPANHRENTVAHRAQPAAFFASRERHIRFRPALGPNILIAVKTGCPHPVLQRELKTVLNSEPALFRAVHQKQSSERPEGLAAEALFALLLHLCDAAAVIRNFASGGQARAASAVPHY